MSRRGARAAFLAPAAIIAASWGLAACERRAPAGSGTAPVTGSVRMGGARPSRDPRSAPEGPDPAPVSGRPFVTFTDVTPGSGLESFRLHAGPEGPKNWVVETTGGGVVVADFDGDGRPDVVVVDGTDLGADGEDTSPPGAGTRIWRNDGGMRFTDVTAASGIAPGGYGLGGASADWDGDGDADLCLVGYDVLRLLRNRGDATFEDVTAACGVEPRRWDCSTACAWADVDGDGRLDLFVSNYVDQRAFIEGVRRTPSRDPRICRSPGGFVSYCGPQGLRPQPNRLFLQREGGRFEDVTATHLQEPARASFQASFSDLDGDGDLDAYVANDGVENSLLVNEGGRLRDRGLETGAATNSEANPQGSMGVALADADEDGRMDVGITNLAHEHNALYLNRALPGGRLRFEEVALRTRFASVGQARVCWGVALRDFDGDGHLDFFTVAGHVFDVSEQRPFESTGYRQRAEIRRGLGPPGFLWEDVTPRAGDVFRVARHWRGASFGDLDGDGDLDVVAAAQHEPPAVLRNDGGEGGGWVRFDLRSESGTPAGARVIAHLADGTVRIADLLCGSSYAGSDEPVVTLGVGTSAVLPRVEIRWPGGGGVRTTVLRDVAVRASHVVRQE